MYFLILQALLIILTFGFICYLVKKFLIPKTNKNIKENAKEIVKKEKNKKPKFTIETDKEIIYYYENGEEFHQPINRR